MDLLLAREILEFIAKGGLLSYPLSFYQELKERIDRLPVLETYGAKEIYQLFKAGLAQLEAQVKNTESHGELDERSKEIWQKLEAMRIKSGGVKGVFLRSVSQKLRQAEKTSRQSYERVGRPGRFLIRIPKSG